MRIKSTRESGERISVVERRTWEKGEREEKEQKEKEEQVRAERGGEREEGGVG